MMRLFSACTACIALAAFVCSEAAAAGDRANDEVRALMMTEMKLAALARMGDGGPPPDAVPAPPPPKKIEKKRPHKVNRRPSRSKPGTVAPVAARQKPLDRRLTRSEVQEIISTTRDFSGADLTGLSLVGVDLRGAKLTRANLHSANLERADLAEADLELTDLTSANLKGASLNQARLRGARLEGAKLDGVLWIDKSVCRAGSIGICRE